MAAHYPDLSLAPTGAVPELHSSQFGQAVGSTPAEFSGHPPAEHERWAKVIKETGIRGTH